ncbi:MAG: hypothetical protein LQ340_006891, partial [Diploschistes diacapsis]
IASCTPIEKYYEPNLPGTCISLVAPDIAWGAMSVISDLAIAVLPMPIIWHMKFNKRDKVLLSFVFLVGLVAFAVALIRWALATADLTSYDRTWKAGMSFLFSILEVNTGIICGCVPTLRPLVRLVRGHSSYPRRKSIAAHMQAAEEQKPLATPSSSSGRSSRQSDQAPHIDLSISTTPFMTRVVGSSSEGSLTDRDGSIFSRETLHLPRQGTIRYDTLNAV